MTREACLLLLAFLALASCAEPAALHAPPVRPEMPRSAGSGPPVPSFAAPDAAAPDIPYAGPDPAAPEGDQPVLTSPAR